MLQLGQCSDSTFLFLYVLSADAFTREASTEMSSRVIQRQRNFFRMHVGLLNECLWFRASVSEHLIFKDAEISLITDRSQYKDK